MATGEERDGYNPSLDIATISDPPVPIKVLLSDLGLAHLTIFFKVGKDFNLLLVV